jgi:hypothetical protein
MSADRRSAASRLPGRARIAIAGCLLSCGLASAAPPKPTMRAPAIDSELRVAYSIDAPSSATLLAGVKLESLVIAGLQLTARSESAPEDGGLVLSFSDGAGVVRAVVQLAVLPDASAARRVLLAELHGVSMPLGRAADSALGDLAWADVEGEGASIIFATQANVAYSVKVLSVEKGVPTASAIARRIRRIMVAGAPLFPPLSVSLPSEISVQRGAELRIVAPGGHPYKVRADGAYIARGSAGPIVRPFGPGKVTVYATVTDELARVSVAKATTTASSAR